MIETNNRAKNLLKQVKVIKFSSHSCFRFHQLLIAPYCFRFSQSHQIKEKKNEQEAYSDVNISSKSLISEAFYNQKSDVIPGFFFFFCQSYPIGSIHTGDGGSFRQRTTKHNIFFARRITVSNFVVIFSASPVQFLSSFVA